MRTEIPTPICADDAPLRATIITKATKKQETIRLIRISVSLFWLATAASIGAGISDSRISDSKTNTSNFTSAGSSKREDSLFTTPKEEKSCRPRKLLEISGGRPIAMFHHCDSVRRDAPSTLPVAVGYRSTVHPSAGECRPKCRCLSCWIQYAFRHADDVIVPLFP